MGWKRAHEPICRTAASWAITLGRKGGAVRWTETQRMLSCLDLALHRVGSRFTENSDGILYQHDMQAARAVRSKLQRLLDIG